ncbi:unnamed protein product [Thelazia callipaeda]|uniref:Uncharacterized protein n=1 Tax=Thelazia callipaeda TaxID=103827 RepID=A0A0N5CX36_THECL|nr:unnamed protein product [Thelazia callipaeda]
MFFGPVNQSLTKKLNLIHENICYDFYNYKNTLTKALIFLMKWRFFEIFHCSFNETTYGSKNPGGKFLSYDIIVFDFGLLHKLIHVEECIANYLDGGYMRCLWCIGQVFVLLAALLVIVVIRNTHPIHIWPVLIVQNAYCFGLVILTIATADKLLTNILHPVNGHLLLLIGAFFLGTCMNHLFDYILWHYYWYREAEYVKCTGHQVISF